MVNKNLIKRLSHSSERPIRDAAFEELESLINNDELVFEDIELRGIFEGIFWCFWFADKPAYQEDLMKRIVKFTDAIKDESKKLMWVRYFFKCLCLHWNSIDSYSMNEYLSLLRSQLVCIFSHIKSLWKTNAKRVRKYMNAIYEESLKESDVPLGVGMHMADIYLDELISCFDKDDLTHKHISQLLKPFLKALGNSKQLALFQRVKEKIFEQLIDKAKESYEYFPKLNLKEYGEVDIFKVASAKDTMESRRSEIYGLYDKATGKEVEKVEDLPYAERLRQIEINALALKSPKTKHQKKKLIRERVK